MRACVRACVRVRVRACSRSDSLLHLDGRTIPLHYLRCFHYLVVSIEPRPGLPATQGEMFLPVQR